MLIPCSFSASDKPIFEKIWPRFLSDRTGSKRNFCSRDKPEFNITPSVASSPTTTSVYSFFIFSAAALTSSSRFFAST